MRKKKILVLVVAYNAEMTIEKLLKRFPEEALKKVDEILIADDASQDRTSEIAIDYKKAYNLEKLKIIKHDKNKGYGGNQKWGYRYAIKNGFDIVVMVHGDAQYPPEQILHLIRPIEHDDVSFMFGSRMTGDPLEGGMPLYKFFANKFLTKIENIILGTKLSEFHSGFRAYDVHTLKKIPLSETSDDYHFDSEIIIQLVIAKKKISEITIPTLYGDEKCHVNGVKYGLNILKIMAQYLANKWGIKKYKKFQKLSNSNKLNYRLLRYLDESI